MCLEVSGVLSGYNNTGSLQGGATYSTIVPTCGPAPTPTPTPTPTPRAPPSPTPTPTPAPSGLNSLLLNGSTSYMNVAAPGASSLNLTGALTVEPRIQVTAS